jgi:hypothetical protein
MHELALRTAPVNPEIVETVRVAAIISPFSTYRIVREIAPGPTIAQIMREIGIDPRANARIFDGARLIADSERETHRPAPGAIVTIRVVPSPPALIAVAIAAAEAAAASAATAAVTTGALAGAGAAIAGATGLSLATVGTLAGIAASGAVGMIGKLLMNALVAPPPPSGPAFTADPARFTISSNQNLIAPFAAIPKVYGSRLISPLQGASPYTEMTGNDQYLRQLFVLGYGPLDISQIRLQDSLIANYEDVEWEFRAGFPDDAPLTLYTGEVVTDSINMLLFQDPNNQPTYEGWQQQTSGTAADELGVDITFPGGLMSIGNTNGFHNPCMVVIQIRYAPTGTTNWTYRPRLGAYGATSAQVIRSDRWNVPRGQYDVQVQVQKVIPYKGNWQNTIVAECYWTALRTIRSAPPYQMQGLAVLAVRIRASKQLNGTINNLNLIASSILPDWDGASWTDRAGAWTYDYDNQGNGASAYALDAANAHTANSRSGSNWITNEQVGTGNGGTTFNFTLQHLPVQPGSIAGTTSAAAFIDDGLGNFTPDYGQEAEWSPYIIYQPGNNVRAYGGVFVCIKTCEGNAQAPPNSTYWAKLVVSGSINYATGAGSITFGAASAAPTGEPILVSYIQQLFTVGGGRALAITTAAGTDGAAVACKNIPTHDAEVDTLVGGKVTPLQWTVSGWFKASAPIPQGVRMRLIFSTDENFGPNDVNNVASYDIISNGAATTSWQQVSATITQPSPVPGVTRAASFFMRVVVYHNPDTVGGVTIYWDDISIVRANGELQRVNVVPNPSFDFPGVITSNPASHFLDVLQGPANKLALPASRIDMAGIETWHGWCASNSRSNNMILDQQKTVFEILREVASYGRASWRMKDGLYSVLQDLPQSTPVQHLTPRNSWGFKATYQFPILPGALKVRFINNATSMWSKDERIVYDDGYNAANTEIYEVLDLTSGCTDPNEAWRDGRYHLAQARLRPQIYELQVDFENLVCTRGDLVLVSHDVLLSSVAWARIAAVQLDGSNNALGVTLDSNVTFESGTNYVLRVRRSDGTSILLALENPAPAGGSATAAQVVFAAPVPAANPQPEAGDLAIFGVSGRETLQMLVTKIIPGPNLTATLQLQDYAPAVYTADSGTPPPFNYGSTNTPAAPAPMVAQSISSDQALPQDADGSRKLAIVHSLANPVQPNGLPYPNLKLATIQYQSRLSALDSTTNNAAPWSSTQAYVVGDTVTDSNGVVWICLEANTNEPPGTLDTNGNGYWSVLTQTDPWSALAETPGDANMVIVPNVEQGRMYDTQIRYKLSDGTVTPWTLVAGHTVVGQASPPADVTNLTATLTSLQGVKLKWTASTSPNVREYEIRTGASWSAGTFVARVRTTHFQDADQALGAATWWVAAVDTSGNYSPNPPSASATIAVQQGIATLANVPDVAGRIALSSAAGFKYYASSGSYTPPSGATSLLVMLAGGGGGGGSGYGNTGGIGGGGGGGGATTILVIPSPSGSYTVTVGAGGAGATIASSPGSNGGNSAISGTNTPAGAVANGGKGGSGGSSSGSAAGGAGGAAAGMASGCVLQTNGLAGATAVNGSGAAGANGTGGLGGNGGNATGSIAGGNGGPGYVIIVPLF